MEVAGTQALLNHNTLMQLSLNLCALMQAWCDNKAFDTVMHPIRDSLQACSTVNQSKVYIPAEGRIECIRVVSLVCL